MTIAVIKTGGKQYKILEGKAFKFEKLLGAVGDKIDFDKVLLIADEGGSNVQLGTPYLEGRKVEAKIVEQGRAKKVVVIKYKRKVRYRRKAGHRQPFTKVEIVKI